ncbi:MAG: 50S ribosomal protein L25 [Opitutales bacterium]|nr:50S ribosomal protein L25 [Opitutales bacterium]MDG1324200.1 50S ribosomal protein L25 [Opitutales bacterium]
MSELSDLTIKVVPRDQTGRQACNKLRASGRIPAVFYGKQINKSYSIEDRAMRILLRKSSGTSSLFRLLGEEGEDELVLIKDMQMDSIKDTITHIDFIQVNRGEDLQTKVPLTLLGEAEGVKTQGGILEALVNEVEIRCRPSNLPSQIELDISNLGLGENLQVKDLPVLEGISYVGELDGMLVSCVGSAGGRSSAGDDEEGESDEMPADQESTEEADSSD